jgi:hypothetical protein
MGGEEVQLHALLTSALDREGMWSSSRSGRLTPGKRPGTQSGPQSQFRGFGEENISYSCRESNYDSSFLQETDIKINL